MGYPKGQGPRRCPGCLNWYDVTPSGNRRGMRAGMVRVGVRFYCRPCAKRVTGVLAARAQGKGVG